MKETFLKKLIKNMEIQSVRIKLPPERNQDFPDLGLRNTIFGAENPFSENMPEAVNKEDKIKVWMAEDIFRCHYIIEIKPGEEEAAIIGPYRIEDMGISEISRRFDKLGFKNINMQYLTRYYHLLPHIRDLNLVYFIVQDHFSEIYGEDAFDLNFFEMELMRSPETVENDEGDSAYQRERLMQVYAQEKLMIDYISK